MSLNEWIDGFEAEIAGALQQFVGLKPTPEVRAHIVIVLTPIYEHWLQLLRGVRDDDAE